MSQEPKFQISGNIGNGYVILKGDTVEEVEALAAKYAEASNRIMDHLNTVAQVALAKDAFSAKENKPFGGGGKSSGGAPAASGGGSSNGSFKRPQNNGGGGSAGQVANGPDGNPTCPHGVKKLDYRKNGGSGTRVHGYYCQNKDRQTQCKPLTLEGHGE